MHTEEDHLAGLPSEIVELYQELKEKILSLGDEIEIRPRKKHIAFVAGSNFVDVHPQKSQLKIWINMFKGELNNPENRRRDVCAVGHWGNGDYEVSAKSTDDPNYLLNLIRQSFAKHSLISRYSLRFLKTTSVKILFFCSYQVLEGKI